MIRILGQPRPKLIVLEHASAFWLARAEDSALGILKLVKFLVLVSKVSFWDPGIGEFLKE